jgi:hypothetical protein
VAERDLLPISMLPSRGWDIEYESESVTRRLSGLSSRRDLPVKFMSSGGGLKEENRGLIYELSKY